WWSMACRARRSKSTVMAKHTCWCRPAPACASRRTAASRLSYSKRSYAQAAPAGNRRGFFYPGATSPSLAGRSPHFSAAVTSCYFVTPLFADMVRAMSSTPPVFEPRRFRTAPRHYLAGRPPYAARLIEDVIKFCGLSIRHRLLDLGSGPGQLAKGFAPKVRSGLGIDTEPE